MSTGLRIGPADHDREISDDEYVVSDFEEGYKYELIDGRLRVAPAPDFAHFFDSDYLVREFKRYAHKRPEIVGLVAYGGVRVFVPAGRRTTVPEPDIAIYRERPRSRKTNWREISPFIVVEVLSPGDPEKDLVRNVDLYRQVPSILEYWIYDQTDEASGPKLLVYRRESGSDDWSLTEYGADAKYTSKLLPGFALNVMPEDA